MAMAFPVRAPDVYFVFTLAILDPLKTEPVGVKITSGSFPEAFSEDPQGPCSSGSP